MVIKVLRVEGNCYRSCCSRTRRPMPHTVLERLGDGDGAVILAAVEY
jgi:hypothetical protein